MSTDDRPMLPEANDRAMTVQSDHLPEPYDSGWAGGGTLSAPSEDPLEKIAPYLHGLRRHSALALGLGLLLVAIVAPLVWLSQEDTYTATAYLRVAPHEERIAFDVTTRRGVQNEFELYRNTQQQLLTTPFVLMAALRDPAAAGTSVVREEEDPIKWLAENVRVRFPGDSEIMSVSITWEKPAEAAALVRAVVQAYRDEVVDVEGRQKRERLSELDRVYASKETEVRAKRNDLKELAKRLGTGQEDALNLKQQNALEVYSTFRHEQMRVQFELLRANGELQAHRSQLDSFDPNSVSELELALMADQDPIAKQLAQQLAWIQSDYLYSQSQARPGAAAPYLERYNRDYALANQQLQAQQERLREQLVMHSQLTIKEKIDELQTQIAVLKVQEEAIGEDLREAREEAERYGVQSIDVEMMRSEIEHLERVLAELASERERLRVEVNSDARVVVLEQAEVPETADRSMRIPLTLLASLFAFCIPLVGLAFWDVRAKRINTPDDVSKRMGLTVVGAVPKIPPRVIKRLGSPTRRHQRWRMQLTESVDGIMARLLRKADLEDSRVLLVTSPVSGEAKTTLATQLAMSLVRNGHRTVLVDFDMRRPSLNNVFGVENEPGVSEVIRGDAALDEAIADTSTELLSLIPAGRWDRQAMAALARGAASGLIDRLREQFDFVLIDSAPVLPVADTRFVSQHVDVVLLSVLRDISRMPKIQAACEILAAFGVKNVETIVTGGYEQAYAKSAEYFAESEG